MRNANTFSLDTGKMSHDRSWDVIDRLRNTARLLLRAVSARSGSRSPRYAKCETIWHRANDTAVVALLRADFQTAIAQLEEAVRVLANTPEATRRP